VVHVMARHAVVAVAGKDACLLGDDHVRIGGRRRRVLGHRERGSR